jgi:uncharacterized protein YceK
MRIFSLALAATVVVLFSGCAAITTGSTPVAAPANVASMK